VNEKIDFVIASDIIYLEREFENLLDTFDEFAEPRKTIIIMATTEHGNRGKFYECLKKRGNFMMSKIDSKYLDE
jgi:predicted nicotinamide N-methyase